MNTLIPYPNYLISKISEPNPYSKCGSLVLTRPQQNYFLRVNAGQSFLSQKVSYSLPRVPIFSPPQTAPSLSYRREAKHALCLLSTESLRSLEPGVMEAKSKSKYKKIIYFCLYFVSQRMPFRSSHDVVEKLVGVCVSRRCELQDLSLEEMKKLSPVFEEDVFGFLGVEKIQLISSVHMGQLDRTVLLSN